jgi:hypothetical protein
MVNSGAIYRKPKAISVITFPAKRPTKQPGLFYRHPSVFGQGVAAKKAFVCFTLFPKSLDQQTFYREEPIFG